MGTGSSAIEKTKKVGNQYFASGDYKKAIIAYSKALNYDKQNCFLLSNRSVCYLKLGNLREALNDALACVQASPQWNKSYYRLASVLKSCGLYSEALYYAEISIKITNDQIVSNLCEELRPLSPQRGRNTVVVWGVSSPRPANLKLLEGNQIKEMY